MKKKFMCMLMAAAMTLSMAACGSKGDDSSNNDASTDGTETGEVQTFTVGTSGPLTGDNAIYGVAVKQGVELAVNEINASDSKIKFEFLSQDDEADGEKAVNAYNNMMDNGMQVLVGPTTTGASILTAVEPLSRGGLFWRSFTHWVGGMGVLVFVMAILPMSDGHTMHILRAEMPGPTAGKLVSRMSDTAKILYGMYFVMTLVMIGLLLLGGMDLFDASVHAFGAAGTGGFSSRNASVGAYNSAYIDVVTGIGMLAFGINFNLYYFLLMRRFRDVAKSEELWAYLGIVAFSTVTIAANIRHLYGAVGTSLRHAFFQVSSIITTTGYATVDFDQWPGYAKTVLVLLMFVGGCAGSTGGGLKVTRVVTLVKAAFMDMRKMIHPNAVVNVRMEGRAMPEKQVRGVQAYFSVYMLLYAVSWLLLSLNGFDLLSTFTALSACINNIGPGLGMVGPTGNFSAFAPWAKLLLSFDMLAGRLEIFPMLVLFLPDTWRKF